ncbi:MAG: acyl-CoA desaturase [Chloroflexia bacterium]
MDQTITSAPINKNDYAKLKVLVQEAGLFETQGRYYAVKLAYTLAMFGVGVALMFLLDGWARALVVAPYLAFVCAQLGFLAHDLGHKQVFGSTRLNNWAGMMIANLLVGMSLGWWNDKHNAHHANPNHDGMDPDVDIPFMAFSEEQAMSKSGLARVIAAYQAFIFFPALTFTTYSIQTASTRFMVRERYNLRFPDVAMLLAHFVLYYVGLPLLLGFWQGLVFILIHRGLLGLFVGAVFAPNHKGMLVVGKDDNRLDFLRKQVLTARNVRSTPIIDFLYGGLNHQAVHHLFPNMPRNKLHAATEITSRFCEERGIYYHVTGVRQSFKEILQSLHETSAPLRWSASGQLKAGE